MRHGRRWLAWLAAAAALWGGYWGLTRSRLIVANESGQEVRGLTVGVGGELLDFGDLAPGESRSARFRVGHEEVFDVRLRLADGTEVHEGEGYVTWEESLFGISARLTVGPGGRLDLSH